MSVDETGLQRLFSMKTHFPNQFHQLLNDGEQITLLDITQHQFPFFANGKSLSFLDGNSNGVVIMMKIKGNTNPNLNVKFYQGDPSTNGVLLTNNMLQSMPDLYMANIPIVDGPVIGNWNIEIGESAEGSTFDQDTIEDIFILFNYKIG